ncbi:helix-turn-helix domain-containing protein [Neobacillus niacini]|uniref:helix-turn-helix domain-containing protein n=1 Tax=Neobacillus niacini TaxID=86668 RepID=UPI0021CB23FD|nr:helix-turn-helix domain-containing protein [Neobacillus niacini]MCM3766892.1 helix-turn-helix domain-containing protein [Neobacillus niacini]
MKNKILLTTIDSNVINLFQQINSEYKFGLSIEEGDKNVLLTEDTLISPETLALLIDLDDMTKWGQDIIHQQLSKKNFPLPVIVLKDRFSNQEMRLLFKNGVFDCLTKPLEEEVVYRLLHELRNELQHSNQRLQQGYDDPHNIMSSLRVSLIYNLLYGNIMSSREIWHQSKLIGLTTVPNTAMAFQIDEFFWSNREKGKQWQDIVRNKIITVTRQLFKNENHESLAMGTAADQYAILLSLPFQQNQDGYKQLAIKLAEQAKKYIHKQTGYTVTIGIGNYFEDVRNLHFSYQEAKNALKHKFFHGKDLVIHQDDTERFDNEFVLLPNLEVSLLANKLMVADISAVSETVRNLFQKLSLSKTVDPEVLVMQISEISTMLGRAAINGGANQKEVHTILQEYSSFLQYVENIAQLEQWLRDLTHRFLDLITNNHNAHTLKSIQKAMEFIEGHYLEGITLEKVASYVHLSPTYFSRIFKNATGRNFVEYITYLRIEKAKELLKDLNYTVYQIAFEVGYSNSHYFSRVFKSMVGKTPSEFRNSILVPSGITTEGLLN